MTALVLVLGCRSAPYPMLIETIKSTWASPEIKDVDVLFYSGGGEFRVDGRDLCLPVPDDLAHVGEKTLAALTYVDEHHDFEVLFRTNCSSYLDFENLLRFVKTRSTSVGFYAGLLGEHAGISFASGSGYFLSRDLVRLVTRHQADWDHSLLDDVALGKLLGRHGVSPKPAPRHDYRRVREVEDVDTTQFHFRCRADSPSRLEDAQIMREVHRAFCALRGWKAIAPVDRAWNRPSLLARLFGRAELSR